MHKVFLKDFIDKRDVYKTAVFGLVLFVLLQTFIENNPTYGELSLSFASLLFIYFALAFNIYYFVKTYTSKENTGAYYQLPVDRNEINLGFIEAITIDTLIRKVLLVLVAFIAFNLPISYFISLIIASPIICIIASVGVSQNISNGKKLLTIVLSILALVLSSHLIINSKLYLVSLVIVASYLFVIKTNFLNEVYFTSSSAGKMSQIKISNYFLKFIISEKVYIINTAGLIIMIIILGLAFPNEMGLPLALMVATINTPLMTVLSTETDINTYKALLPATHKSLAKDYFKMIIAYYILVHLIIVGLFWNELSLKIIILIIGLVVFETLGAYYLETNHPIKNKKTTTEVWKHPRKYILGIIAFLLGFVVVNIL